jgi:hypothetical protein
MLIAIIACPQDLVSARRDEYANIIMGIILAVFCMAGFLVGLLISAVLIGVAALCMQRDAKQRRHGWWSFCIITVLMVPCALLLVHSRPAALHLPDSVDWKNLFLNFVGYGGSLGAAAAIACLVTLIIPRPKRGVPPVHMS